jgi:hypothetical protein
VCPEPSFCPQDIPFSGACGSPGQRGVVVQRTVFTTVISPKRSAWCRSGLISQSHRARMSCVLYVSMLSIGRERSCTVGGGCGFRDKRWREGGRLSTSNTAWVRGVCATRQCTQWCPTGKRVGGENRGRMGEWEEGRRIVHTRMNGSGRW